MSGDKLKLIFCVLAYKLVSRVNTAYCIQQHTDGEEGSPEDTEILQFTVDAISSENEVTDTRTITDDHMVENELMQEIEQEVKFNFNITQIQI